MYELENENWMFATSVNLEAFEISPNTSFTINDLILV